MRRLHSGVPRAFKDHRSGDARAYATVLRAITERLGVLPRYAAPMLREYGRAVLALDDLAAEYTQARARHRVTAMRRIRREQSRLRLTQLALERRIEQLARVRRAEPSELAELLKVHDE
jgi:hypothetical protein